MTPDPDALLHFFASIVLTILALLGIGGLIYFYLF